MPERPEWADERAWAVPEGGQCTVHGGVEMNTFCDGFTGYCTKWDGTQVGRFGDPNCQFVFPDSE